MHHRVFLGLCAALFSGALVPHHARAGAYDSQIQQAAQWLGQGAVQNLDGSWGDAEALKHLATSEVVIALRATNNRNAAYFSGITWLQNHDAPNIDYKARRVLALAPHGANLSTEVASLLRAQNSVMSGNRGWGLTTDYHSAAVDTALTLQALREAGVSGAGLGDAVTYLTSAQLPSGNRGWAQGAETASEPVSTALALLALVPLRAQTPSLSVPIANAVAALGASVSSASANSVKAIAAYALLKENPTSPAAGSLVAALLSARSAAGHWDADPYTTALAMRALAAADGIDFNAGSTVVDIPDPNLRAALLQALGKPPNAPITRADLASLSALNLANAGITNLQGLQFATGLTSLNLRGNRLVSIEPIQALIGKPGVQVTLNVIERDLGGDHRADVLWWNRQTGAHAYWFMNGANALTSGSFSLSIALPWRPVAIGDFDGDGRADVLVRNRLSGQNAIWLGNGAQVTSVETSRMSDPAWRVAALADFNGDGKADILWRHGASGQNQVWFMNGATVSSTSALAALADRSWKVAGTGDFNGDGRADILWRHAGSGANTLWLQNGAATTQSINLAAIPDPSWTVGAVADFDGDGRVDIFWRNTASGDNVLWLMEGAAVASIAPVSRQSGSWQLASAADFDGDSRADLLWLDPQTGQATVWLMRGSEVLSQALPGSSPFAAQGLVVGTQQPDDGYFATVVQTILMPLDD
jgi:hypothetical protein